MVTDESWQPGVQHRPDRHQLYSKLTVLRAFSLTLTFQTQTSDRSLVWNTDLMETMELENLLINAAITMHSAERRKVRRRV